MTRPIVSENHPQILAFVLIAQEKRPRGRQLLTKDHSIISQRARPVAVDRSQGGSPSRGRLPRYRRVEETSEAMMVACWQGIIPEEVRCQKAQRAWISELAGIKLVEKD